MGQNYPYWNDWYKVAEPLNKIAGLLTIIFSVLWWVLNPIQHTGYNTTLLVESIWRLVLGILAGIFYILFVHKAVEARILDSEMHIWLWVCFVLSWFPGIAGILIWIQFIMVGILSDIPFWEAFGH